MNENVLKKLSDFGIYDDTHYFYDAFSRNIGLMTREEMLLLKNAKVAIPGMGGVGGVHLMTLVRTGVGNFHIADFDRFEPVNINRQYGANINTFGRNKIDVMAENALAVNPFLNINKFENGIDEGNIDSFLDGVDVVIDGLDFFKFETRRLLFKKAAEKGIFVITAGPLGFSCAMLVFSPQGMGFDEYLDIKDKMTDEDKYLSFALGLAPKPTHIKYMNMKKVSLKSKAGPSLNIACQVCSGMASAEAVKIILKKGNVLSVPYFFQFDPFLHKYQKGRLLFGNKNFLQKLKMSIVKWMIEKNKPVMFQPAPEVPELNIKDGSINKKVMDFLVAAGAQAPSGDNCQPWRFVCSDNQIALYLDTETDYSFFNVNQIASLISCGAAAENIKIASSLFGLDCEIFYNFELNELPIVKIELRYLKKEKDFLAQEIWERNTNRKLYRKKEISKLVLEELRSEVIKIPGADISFITERDKLKKAAKLIYEADRIRAEYRPLHEHLMEMIRFTDKDAYEKKDGFHLKNLEAGFAGELFLKATKSWKVMSIANKAGLGRAVAYNSYKGILNSSGIALISFSGKENDKFVKGGQALERFWLKISEFGLSMQPMTAITLFLLRFQMNGAGDFPENKREVIETLNEKFRSLFSDIDFDSRGQIMLLRFGYSDNIKYRTLRKSF